MVQLLGQPGRARDVQGFERGRMQALTRWRVGCPCRLPYPLQMGQWERVLWRDVGECGTLS